MKKEKRKKGDIKTEVEKFFDVLELLIHDLELEVNQGKKLKIYFDTPDIADAIEGISGFYDYSIDGENSDLEFNEEVFFCERTLVRCLAISGMLGKIHLLLPHQGELSKKITGLLQFGTDINVPPDKLAEIFLNNTDFKDFHWKEVSQNESAIKKAFREFSSDRAKMFFKTVQFLQPWYNRLIEMTDSGILETPDSLHYQPSNILDLLFKLKEILDKYKPYYPINNYTDSLALGTLIEEIRKYETGVSNEIPCLFLSDYVIYYRNGKKQVNRTQSSISKVLNDPEFTNYFTYGKGKKISVIRNDAYFILRGTFTFKREPAALLEELKEWQKQIKEILETANLPQINKTIEDLQSTEESNWTKLITERDNDTFFKNVWLSSEVPLNAYNKAIRGIIGDSEKVRQSNAAKDIADKRIRRTVKKWKDQTELVNDIGSMWKELDTRVEKWRNIEDFKDLDQEDLEQKIFKEFGFFRYSFPSETRSRITENIKDLLEDGESEIRARRRILSYYIQCRETTKIEPMSLAILASSLLVLERNRNLKDILAKSLKSQANIPLHFSFKIIYGKLLLDTDQKKPIRPSTYNEISKIIEELFIEFNREKNNYEKSRIMIGIAYLYYWLWIGQEGQATWRKHWQEKRKKILISKN